MSPQLHVAQVFAFTSLSKAFFVTETEVTVEQFRRFRNDFEGTSAFWKCSSASFSRRSYQRTSPHSKTARNRATPSRRSS